MALWRPIIGRFSLIWGSRGFLVEVTLTRRSEGWGIANQARQTSAEFTVKGTTFEEKSTRLTRETETRPMQMVFREQGMMWRDPGPESGRVIVGPHREDCLYSRSNGQSLQGFRQHWELIRCAFCKAHSSLTLGTDTGSCSILGC